MKNPDFFTICEIGGRPYNQDDFFVPDSESEQVYVVCDGVGGIPGGEIASGLVCQTLPSYFENREPVASLSSYLHEKLNNKINEVPPEKIRASTTLTFARLTDVGCLIGWCGDSRVYHIRNGSILFKTEDHSLVNDLVQVGELSEEEANWDFRKHIILRAVDLIEEPQIEYHEISDLKKGDFIVLVTDGITEKFTDQDFQTYFTADQSLSYLKETVKDICKTSPDNFTMIAIHVK